MVAILGGVSECSLDRPERGGEKKKGRICESERDVALDGAEEIRRKGPIDAR